MESDDDLLDNGLADFADYEAYLDEQMTEEDLFYLEDRDLARKLFEVGFIGKGEIIDRKAFDEK